MRYYMREVVVTTPRITRRWKQTGAILCQPLAVARECCQADDVEQCRLFIRAVGALARFLGFRNALNERVAWGKSALEVAELLEDTPAIAELCASAIAWPCSSSVTTQRQSTTVSKASRRPERCSDPRVAARWAGNAARSLSGIARDADDGPKAQHWAKQAAMYARRCEDASLIRGAQLDFGYAALLLGNFDEAEHLFAELLEGEERGKTRSGSGIARRRRYRADEPGTEVRGRRRPYPPMRSGPRVSGTQPTAGREDQACCPVRRIEISLATLARIQGDEAEFRRLRASGRRRFEELGISRQGRAEQFVIFPADWRPDSQAQPADY